MLSFFLCYQLFILFLLKIEKPKKFLIILIARFSSANSRKNVRVYCKFCHTIFVALSKSFLVCVSFVY